MEKNSIYIKSNYRNNHYNSQYVQWICLLFTVMIIGRSLNDVFFYVFTCVSIFIFSVSTTKHCVSFLLFLLPSSTILKFRPDSISIFTILFFIVVVKQILSNPHIEKRTIVSLLFFFCYNLFFSGIEQLVTIASLVAGMLMLYYTRDNNQINHEHSIVVFSIGICFASILAVLKSSLPIVSNLVTNTVIKLQENNYFMRFSGLQGNPNYYTLDVIVALSAIIVLIFKERQRTVYFLLAIALSLFGMMSLSKSFILAWLVLFICALILACKNGMEKLLKFAILAIIGGIIASVYFQQYIGSIIIRFEQDNSASINSITTGRSGIWEEYLYAIIHDIRLLFFGNGLKTILALAGKGVHNTYLEGIFTMGIVGFFIFLICIKNCVGRIDYRSVLIPIILLLIRMFAITILTYDNLWFYILVIQILSNGLHNSRNRSLGYDTRYKKESLLLN